MRLKILYIPLCLLLAVPATAQNETMRKVQTKEKKESAINTESINKTIKPIGNKTETMLPYYKEKEEERAIERESIRLKISIPHQYYGNNAILPFTNKIYFYLESDNKRYINLTNYNLAYLAIGSQLNSNLSLTGGLIAMRQYMNASRQGSDRSGVRLNLNYAITTQLAFKIWGEYITGSSIDSPLDNLLPQTGIGSSLILNLGGGSQLDIGAEYRKDENKEKWNYNAGGKLKLNF